MVAKMRITQTNIRNKPIIPTIRPKTMPQHLTPIPDPPPQHLTHNPLIHPQHPPPNPAPNPLLHPIFPNKIPSILTLTINKHSLTQNPIIKIIACTADKENIESA